MLRSSHFKSESLFSCAVLTEPGSRPLNRCPHSRSLQWFKYESESKTKMKWQFSLIIRLASDSHSITQNVIHYRLNLFVSCLIKLVFYNVTLVMQSFHLITDRFVSVKECVRLLLSVHSCSLARSLCAYVCVCLLVTKHVHIKMPPYETNPRALNAIEWSHWVAGCWTCHLESPSLPVRPVTPDVVNAEMYV